MSPRSAEQFDGIRKEKKKLILDTALELFAENGFHATSISQIAKKAGISKGLTYNYFDSKKEILDDIITEGFDTIYSNFDINQDGILTEEEFIYFIKQSFQLMRENMRYWKLYYSLMLQPKVAESFQEEYSEKARPFLNKLFQFVVSKGSKDPEGDLMVISALFEGAYLFAITAPEMFPGTIMEDKIINACFKIING
jgi:AcrR family transcriptional regulator